jgi:hypothetical protein
MILQQNRRTVAMGQAGHHLLSDLLAMASLLLLLLLLLPVVATTAAGCLLSDPKGIVLKETPYE